ncbi:hypothetical protein ACFV0B_41390, partial [Streptomyces xanthophaeus]|uniref:hypothetical protein n=1 Tax=Streptomyces xanthophaeus TaxID=67385 RepID=UPI003692BBAF
AAAVQGIDALNHGGVGVRSLQEHAQHLTAARATGSNYNAPLVKPTPGSLSGIHREEHGVGVAAHRSS